MGNINDGGDDGDDDGDDDDVDNDGEVVVSPGWMTMGTKVASHAHAREPVNNCHQHHHHHHIHHHHHHHTREAVSKKICT